MSSPQALRRFTFGGRMPAVVGVLVALTFAASIAGALFPMVGGYGALIPARVLHGEAWRLFTWGFFELDPMGLIFGCLMLYWFGRDLCWAWGPRHFLVTYLGM